MSDVLAATLKEAIDGAGDLEHKSVLQVELGALLSVKQRTAFVVNGGLRSDRLRSRRSFTCCCISGAQSIRLAMSAG